MFVKPLPHRANCVIKSHMRSDDKRSIKAKGMDLAVMFVAISKSLTITLLTYRVHFLFDNTVCQKRNEEEVLVFMSRSLNKF